MADADGAARVTVGATGSEAWRSPDFWETEALHERGQRKLDELGGLGLVDDLAAVAAFDPALAHYFLQFQFGEVLSRPNLDVQTRLLCALAAVLVDMEEPIIEAVMRSYLRNGGDKQKIVEVVLQTGCFSGFPKWAVGARLGLKVFRELGIANDPADVAWKEPDFWNKEGLWERGWATRGRDLRWTRDADRERRPGVVRPPHAPLRDGVPVR
jgi:4-carboxymuconolactone decarboxylase